MQARSAALSIAREKAFDLAVIGGGIVGAGIAQNAASRGLSVILIDKSDFASGTSSKTTKLIHGGLRYLQQFQFRLTRQLCSERSLLEQLAPHLVKISSFILPVTNEQALFGLKAEAGLTIYDLIASDKKTAKRHQRLNKKEVLAAVPSLSADNLNSGLRFFDCVTDDARLVFEVIKSAETLGAVTINYLSAQSFELENNRIARIVCRDRFSGQDISIACSTVVNATGVWSDSLMEKLDTSWRTQVTPAKGTHIMLPSSVFETNSALFLPARDGRYVFVVPWQRALMVGTTDTPYKGSLDNPLADEDEIAYLLETINSYGRKDRRIKRADVIASWAGLRPLVGNGGAHGADTKSMSREHKIFEGRGGMIGIVGGKLTNYRILADEAVKEVAAKLPSESKQKLQKASTETIMLGGWDSKDDYLTSSAEISAKARKVGIEPATIDHLISTYGKDALKIVDLVEGDQYLNKRVCPDFPPIMAEAVYSVKYEMALCLEDILFRRMRLGLIHQAQCLNAAAKVGRCVQGVLGWDDTRTQAELKALTATLEEHLN